MTIDAGWVAPEIVFTEADLVWLPRPELDALQRLLNDGPRLNVTAWQMDDPTEIRSRFVVRCTVPCITTAEAPGP